MSWCPVSEGTDFAYEWGLVGPSGEFVPKPGEAAARAMLAVLNSDRFGGKGGGVRLARRVVGPAEFDVDGPAEFTHHVQGGIYFDRLPEGVGSGILWCHEEEECAAPGDHNALRDVFFGRVRGVAYGQ
jgi:hypothetical protein